VPCERGEGPVPLPGRAVGGTPTVDQPAQGFMRSGFVLALALRLLTASMAIVVPLFAAVELGASPAGAGTFVVLLWVGNAVGVVLAVTTVRDQSLSSGVGFGVLGLAMGALAGTGGGGAPLLVTLVAGVGMGLPQPFLSGLMHLESDPRDPFRGLGMYSTGLGIGLFLGPLLAYGIISLYGFAGVFLALAAVCALGVGGAIAGRRGLAGKPRPPSPALSEWLRAFRGGAFKRAFAVNLLYALLLPVFLSYGAIYAEGRFGFTPAQALLAFSAVFGLSTAWRVAVVGFKPRLKGLLVVSLLLLLGSSLCLGLAPSWPFLVAGMLLFSLPNALVYPVTSFYAFSSVEGENVLNASYVFQASSGVAELVSPAAAIILLPGVGVHGLFLIGGALAAAALMLAGISPPWDR
jgi:hypothetical protein